jgi:hypothetical protein
MNIVHAHLWGRNAGKNRYQAFFIRGTYSLGTALTGCGKTQWRVYEQVGTGFTGWGKTPNEGHGFSRAEPA